MDWLNPTVIFNPHCDFIFQKANLQMYASLFAVETEEGEEGKGHTLTHTHRFVIVSLWGHLLIQGKPMIAFTDFCEDTKNGPHHVESFFFLLHYGGHLVL